jgi:hypothetical protein
MAPGFSPPTQATPASVARSGGAEARRDRNVSVETDEEELPVCAAGLLPALPSGTSGATVRNGIGDQPLAGNETALPGASSAERLRVADPQSRR